jgi:hypothetical protein
MRPGTSPGAALRANEVGRFNAAFHGGADHLWTDGPIATFDLTATMAPGTSPSSI